jgi:ribonuclease HI
LGAPVGGEHFCEAFLNKEVDRIVQQCQELMEVNLPRQSSLALLLGSIIHKPRYLLRVSPPHISEGIFERLDTYLLSVILNFVELPIENANINVLKQLSLPRKLGGLGIGDFARSAKASYFASVLDSCKSAGSCGVLGLDVSQEASHCPQNLAGIHNTLVNDLGDVDAGWTKLWSITEPLQKYLVNKVNVKAHTSLIGGFHPASSDARRLMLLRGKGSSNWLAAAPLKRETMNNHQYSTGLKLRLGLPLTSSIPVGCRVFCPCTKELVPPTLEHALACNKGNMALFRKDRHDALRDKLFRWLAINKMQVEREVPLRRIQGEVEVDGNPKRMDLVCILANQLVWTDITVVNGNTEARRAKGEDYPADVAATAKQQKYAANVTLQGATFFPAAIESYGGLSKSFLELVDRLVDAVYPRTSRRVKARKKQELIAGIEVELVMRQCSQFDEFCSSFHAFTKWVHSPDDPVPDMEEPSTEEPSESQLHLAQPGHSALGELHGQNLPQATTDTLNNQAEAFAGILCQSDGASRNNGGDAGAGAVCYLVAEDGTKSHVGSSSHYLGQRTSPQAEYEGLLIGMRLVADGIKENIESSPHMVRFELDAQLVVNQMNGFAQVGNILKPLFERARTELLHLRSLPMVENVEICYLPRGLNSVADDLAKTARCPVENVFSALDQPPIATRPVHEIEKFIRLHGDQVLVQWKGYPDCSDFTWELESDLRDDLQNDPLVDSLKEAAQLTEGLGAQEDFQHMADLAPHTALSGTAEVMNDGAPGNSGSALPSSTLSAPTTASVPTVSARATLAHPCVVDMPPAEASSVRTSSVVNMPSAEASSGSTSSVVNMPSAEASSGSTSSVEFGRRRSTRVRTRPSRFCLSSSPSSSPSAS